MEAVQLKCRAALQLRSEPDIVSYLGMLPIRPHSLASPVVMNPDAKCPDSHILIISNCFSNHKRCPYNFRLDRDGVNAKRM
jgi:hypothetical protein